MDIGAVKAVAFAVIALDTLAVIAVLNVFEINTHKW